MILLGGRTSVVYGASRLSLDNLHNLQENGKSHKFTGNLEDFFIMYVRRISISMTFISSSNNLNVEFFMYCKAKGGTENILT